MFMGRPLRRGRRQVGSSTGELGNGNDEDNDSNDDVLLTKRSIFFELSHWKDNCLRHSLDAMHVEKNVVIIY